MLSLGGVLTMRTNWQVYAEEFFQALKLSQIDEVESHLLNVPIESAYTPFERKYIQSHHTLYEVIANL